MGRSGVLRLGVLGFLAAAAVGAGWGALRRWWPLALSSDPGRALPGLQVDGATPPESLRPYVVSRARALEQRKVRLMLRDGGENRAVLEAPLRDLGISVDVDAVTARALRLGRTEDTWTRARLADRAHRGELDVPLEPNVDPNVTVQRLAALKEDLDEPPQSARMDIDHHGVVPEHYGRALDIDAAAVDLARAALDSRVVEIDLVFRSVAPSVTREALAHVDISRVLASFSTYFSRRGDHEPRARNIEVAASHIDGLVIEPGQVVSFNAVVGARSEDNGFAKAYEIFKGEYVEGTGGGTCQVASTLHAVAFFAGLEVVQRLPHSRPSAYIPAGLDATVVFPTVDLKLRNPFSFPVVLHARVGKNDIKMELLGADKPVDVTFDKEVLSTTPFGRKVVEEPGRDKPKRKQKGIDGMQLRRSRWLAFHDGHRRVESSRDTYPPTQEIWQIPPGYDERDLPALGEDLDAKDSGLQAPGSGSDTAGVL